MRRIVAASLKFRSIIIALAAALMIVGGAQLSSASVDVFPEFAPPKVEVQTACLGLTAAEVEELVSVPMEEAFNGIDGLDHMRSKSVPQLSSIVMEFENGTDLLTARQLVSERMADGHPDPADLGCPAADAAALVLDQPGHEDRPVLGHAVADRDVHDFLLEHQGPSAAGSGGGQRRHLGRTPPDAPGAGGSGQAGSQRRHPGNRDELNVGRAGRGPAALLPRRRDRYRRFAGYTRTRPLASGTYRRSRRRKNWRRWRSRTGRARLRCGSSTSPTWWRTTSS